MAKAAGKGGDAGSRRQQSGREKAVQQPQNVSQQTTLLTCCEGRHPRCQAQKARGRNALWSAPEGRKKQSSASACNDSTACKPLMTVDIHTHTHACKAFHCAQVFDILINNSLPIHPWVRNSFGASHLREVAWSAQTRSCSISGGDDHSGHQSRSRGLS